MQHNILPVEGDLVVAATQTKVWSVFLLLTFGINISGTNYRAELCVSDEGDASGALLHGQSTADGLGSLYRQRAMRYGR